MSKPNEQTISIFRLHCKDTVLCNAFSKLVELCDLAKFDVIFGADYASGFTGSSYDKQKIVFLQTESKVGNRSTGAILISLAHEYGHIQDPILNSDLNLSKKSITREYCEREKQRELAAWDWAEAWLQSNGIWHMLSQEFIDQKITALAAYRIEWEKYGFIDTEL